MATGVEVARISVKVSPDTKKFRRELLSDLNDIERSVTATIDVEPNMGNFRKEVEAKTKGMKTSVKVDADVDQGFFDRMINKVKSIDGPGFGSGINPMGYAAILGGVVALAAPLMGILTTALLAVPGILAGIAAPIGALTLGLDGLKSAAERLKAPFDQIKATMSEAVKGQFGPVFDQLGKIFPTLERSLPGVTQGMADMAKSLADTLTSGPGLAKLDSIIGNVSAALSKAAPGIGSFTDGFLTLADELSKKFPNIADWFNGAGQSFSDWVQKITADGSLSTAFDGIGGTLKSILDTVGAMAENGMKFFEDPKKIEDFNTALSNVGTILAGIVDLSNQLNKGNLFTSALPSIDFEKMKSDFLTPFTSADAPWRDMWAGMKNAWEETKSSLLASIEVVKTAFNTAWQVIASTATSAWTAVTTVVSTAVSTIQGIVSGIGATISGIWDTVTGAASAAWSGVVAAVQGAWNTIVSAVQAGVAQAVQYVSELPGKIQSFFADAGTWLLEAGKNVVQGLINGIGSMISSAVAKATELASSVKNAVTSFLGIHSPSRVFEEIGNFTAQGFGNGLENGFQPVIDQAKGLAAQIAEVFANGGDPTALLNGMSKQDVDRMEKVLGLESNRLGSQAKALDYQAKISGDKSLKSRADEIRQMQDQIGLQKQMLDLTQDYNDTLSDAGDNPLAKAAGDLMNVPADFAKATAGQFMSDLGISGNGIISKGLTEGIKYIFQIGSVDEALSIKDRTESKAALASSGRR